MLLTPFWLFLQLSLHRAHRIPFGILRHADTQTTRVIITILEVQKESYANPSI